ncbi:MAG: hypothetical protein HC817_07100, partial [Saprospiraceae bacterium]|nr:hypothetical protein [Saprospiraceae bacterium]
MRRNFWHRCTTIPAFWVESKTIKTAKTCRSSPSDSTLKYPVWNADSTKVTIMAAPTCPNENASNQYQQLCSL